MNPRIHKRQVEQTLSWHVVLQSEDGRIHAELDQCVNPDLKEYGKWGAVIGPTILSNGFSRYLFGTLEEAMSEVEKQLKLV